MVSNIGTTVPVYSRNNSTLLITSCARDTEEKCQLVALHPQRPGTQEGKKVKERAERI